MRIDQERLEIRTNGKGLYEITDEIQSKIDNAACATERSRFLFSTPVAA